MWQPLHTERLSHEGICLSPLLERAFIAQRKKQVLCIPWPQRCFSIWGTLDATCTESAPCDPFHILLQWKPSALSPSFAPILSLPLYHSIPMGRCVCSSDIMFYNCNCSPANLIILLKQSNLNISCPCAPDHPFVHSVSCLTDVRILDRLVPSFSEMLSYTSNSLSPARTGRALVSGIVQLVNLSRLGQLGDYDADDDSKDQLNCFCCPFPPTSTLMSLQPPWPTTF